MIRFSVQFSEQQENTLSELATEMGTTKAGVLKKALSLLDVAVRERKDGRELVVVKGDRVIKELFGLDC